MVLGRRAARQADRLLRLEIGHGAYVSGKLYRPEGQEPARCGRVGAKHQTIQLPTLEHELRELAGHLEVADAHQVGRARSVVQEPDGVVPRGGRRAAVDVRGNIGSNSLQSLANRGGLFYEFATARVREYLHVVLMRPL